MLKYKNVHITSICGRLLSAAVAWLVGRVLLTEKKKFEGRRRYIANQSSKKRTKKSWPTI
jgi:hypothetical protein